MANIDVLVTFTLSCSLPLHCVDLLRRNFITSGTSIRMAAHNYLRLVCAALLLHFSTQAAGQNCYYPNGDVAEGMAACTSEGGTCCPLNWSCLSNGLCYLENADYFGRYTCTDQDWASDSQCPNYCTQSKQSWQASVSISTNEVQTTPPRATRQSNTARTIHGAAIAIEIRKTTAATTMMPKSSI